MININNLQYYNNINNNNNYISSHNNNNIPKNNNKNGQLKKMVLETKYRNLKIKQISCIEKRRILKKFIIKSLLKIVMII